MNETPLTICYFGIYPPAAPRDKVYLEGMKKRGVRVVTCVDASGGVRKLWRLAGKHRALRNGYDLLWVGYSSALVAPLARLLTRKKIVYNALNSWYETAVTDRAMYRPFSPRAVFVWCVDFLAFHLASLSLVESEAQKEYIARMFRVSRAKLAVVYTGADESIFHPDPAVKKAGTFTAIFRGMFLPATGVEYVLEAAKLLKDEGIDFIIIGWGGIQEHLKKTIEREKLARLRLITTFLPPDELRNLLLSSHVMLGQFGDHERLERTIQHKTFEALALGMPYITRGSKSNRELLTGGENCIFVPPADPSSIAEAILRLKNNPALREKLARGAGKIYKEKLRNDLLAEKAFGCAVGLLA